MKSARKKSTAAKLRSWRVLGKLGLVHRSDPATMAIAKLIIQFAKAGEPRPRAAVRLNDAATIK